MREKLLDEDAWAVIAFQKVLRDEHPALVSGGRRIPCVSIPRGWQPRYKKLIEDVEAALGEWAPVFRISQTKVTEGGLAVAVTFDSAVPREVVHQVDRLIAQAEEDVSRICEMCGEEGREWDIRNWPRWLCVTHAFAKCHEGAGSRPEA